jgi:GH25 family lysozyme M1 (1,4-beta-N-acetylmuramidase)
MSKLTAYDFWLEEEADLPDYPYKFSMWQYKKSGTVDGVSGVVNLNISFVDYTEK